MIYDHWSEAPWDRQRWPNFTPAELACKHCGEFFYDPAAFDTIQRARKFFGGPLTINSAHRCRVHNARIGGAPMSQHKKIAFDVSIRGRDKKRVLESCINAGFQTFGFYGSFLHVDLRPGRKWATAKGKITWNGLVK